MPSLIQFTLSAPQMILFILRLDEIYLQRINEKKKKK